jgi:hypothetical protein
MTGERNLHRHLPYPQMEQRLRTAISDLNDRLPNRGDKNSLAVAVFENKKAARFHNPPLGNWCRSSINAAFRGFLLNLH